MSKGLTFKKVKQYGVNDINKIERLIVKGMSYDNLVKKFGADKVDTAYSKLNYESKIIKGKR